MGGGRAGRNDAPLARALQVGAVRTHPLLAWVGMRDPPEYPGEFVARLVTDGPTPSTCCWPTPWPGFRLSCRPTWCGPTVNRPTRLRWSRSGSPSEPCRAHKYREWM